LGDVVGVALSGGFDLKLEDCESKAAAILVHVSTSLKLEFKAALREEMSSADIRRTSLLPRIKVLTETLEVGGFPSSTFMAVFIA
jgi:hypothetical protein